MVPRVILPNIQDPGGTSLCGYVSSLNIRWSKRRKFSQALCFPVYIKMLALGGPRYCTGSECGHQFTSDTHFLLHPIPLPPSTCPLSAGLLLPWELL